jgi:hypothetical protein
VLPLSKENFLGNQQNNLPKSNHKMPMAVVAGGLTTEHAQHQLTVDHVGTLDTTVDVDLISAGVDTVLEHAVDTVLEHAVHTVLEHAVDTVLEHTVLEHTVLEHAALVDTVEAADMADTTNAEVMVDAQVDMAPHVGMEVTTKLQTNVPTSKTHTAAAIT